jgi:hypothetical protein
MRRMIIMMAAFAVVGCVRTHRNEATGAVDVDIESPTKKGEDWSGSLSPRSGSAITGSFKALVADGKTTISVNLANAMAGQRLPWHVHKGSCDNDMGIVGSASQYPVIVVANDGTASSNTVLGVSLDEAENYFVNVHASPTNMQTIVACGDLDD